MIMGVKTMACFLPKIFIAVFFLALLVVQGVSADHRSISIQLDAQVAPSLSAFYRALPIFSSLA